MGIMMLAAEPGSEITLLITGQDENEAFEALNDLVVQKFYEDEK
jgi:phosphotransferase system HPr (HPr) family protein